MQTRHYILATLAAANLILGCALIAHAEPSTLPEAPKLVTKPHFDKTTWALLGANAGFRALDVYSTHQMLTRGYHEIVIPKAIADHNGTMAAYSAGAVALDYFAARFLVKHHHPMLAKIALTYDAGQDGFWAVHNLTLKPAKR